MKCYWLVNTKNVDEDKIIYTEKDYNIGEVVNGWRVIDKDELN